MFTTLFYIIYVSFVLPEDSLRLPRACATIETYSSSFIDNLYCAPFTGNTVYSISNTGMINAESFTDDPRERIIDFAVTPFAFFINNGQTIVRYFRSTMESMEVIKTGAIASFAITHSEEIIYVDPRERSVYLLDYTGEEKTRIEDIVVRDMVVTDSILYLLTPSYIALYDGFGNVLKEIPHAGSFTGIHIQKDRMFLFTHGQRKLHVFAGSLEQIYELPIIIQGMTGVGPHIYVLDKRGTVLYRFSDTDF
jgi:hypothetical protein